MLKPQRLSAPVYAIPMDAQSLVLMGRIAVGWGQLIFTLDQIMFCITPTSPERLREYPTYSLKRKLGDLSRELSKPEHAEVRPALIAAHSAIDRLASDRNVIFHGLWGYELDREHKKWQPISRSYTREEPFRLEDLEEFHERLISAVEAAADAFWIVGVGDGPPPQERNRLQLWSDGPPAADDPPPPPRVLPQ